MSAAYLSMLQTPPVTKMTPKKRISTPKGITPQSILKVKNLITATSPSPSSQNITPNSQGKFKILCPTLTIKTQEAYIPLWILKGKLFITATSPSPSSHNITPNSQGKPKIPCPTLTFKTPKVTTRPSILKGKKLMFISPKGHNHNSTIYSQG